MKIQLKKENFKKYDNMEDQVESVNIKGANNTLLVAILE